MFPNLLALFDAIQKFSDASENEIENALVDLALSLGMSLSEIEDALYSERCLVVYEP